jgi:hypothetical protein
MTSLSSDHTVTNGSALHTDAWKPQSPPLGTRQPSQRDASTDDPNTGVTDALRPSLPTWITANPAPGVTSGHPEEDSRESSPSGHAAVPDAERPSGLPRRLSKPQPHTPAKLGEDGTGLNKRGEPAYTRRPATTPILRPEYRYCGRDEIIKPYRAHHCRMCGTVRTRSSPSNVFVS